MVDLWICSASTLRARPIVPSKTTSCPEATTWPRSTSITQLDAGNEDTPETWAFCIRSVIRLLVDEFRLTFACTGSAMFHGPPERLHDFVIKCKRCSEHIAAPVRTMPADWIIHTCPLCGERRRYLPAESSGADSHSTSKRGHEGWSWVRCDGQLLRNNKSAKRLTATLQRSSSRRPLSLPFV